MGSFLNKIQLIGNITSDIEVKQMPNGSSVANFSIATSRSWKGQDGNKQEVSEFHPCVLFGKIAEIAGQYAGKGKKVYLEGRLQTRSWEVEGVKKYKTEIVGESLILLSPNTNSQPQEQQQEFSDDLGINFDDEPVRKGPPANTYDGSEISIDSVPF